MFIDTLGNWFWNIFFILLILFILIFIYFIFNSVYHKKITKIQKISLLFLGFFLITILLIPAPWARYYPFIYLIPLVSLFLIRKKILLKKIILWLYIFNILLIFWVSLIFHYKLALAKYREITWINNDLNKIWKVYYYFFYKDSYSTQKLIKEYNFNKKNFIIVKEKQDILKKCNFKKQPQEKIIYCKNWIFIYPNYGSYIGEYMFLEYKK